MNNFLRQAGAMLSRGFVQTFLSLLFISMWIASANAQGGAPKEFRGDLFPPDLILREAEPLGLSDDQRGAITALVKETKKVFVDGQAKLRETTDLLAQTVKGASIPEQTALDQFTATLEAEKEMKRAQFLMLIRAKNLLTPLQLAKLRAIVESQPPKGSGKKPTSESGQPDVRQELNARMLKVQAEVDRWRREGRDPGPILELMKTFGDQMQAGQMPEAKETLQRALERLNAPARP
ncbi:MAG TPA: hypothetical protein VK961_12235 [Chthoniobacter sp.]|nr:hypothetical protein [Chthoniobacter sp.]